MDVCACFPHQESATPNCLGKQPRPPAREGPPNTHLNAKEQSCTGPPQPHRTWVHAAGLRRLGSLPCTSAASGLRVMGARSTGERNPNQAPASRPRRNHSLPGGSLRAVSFRAELRAAVVLVRWARLSKRHGRAQRRLPRGAWDPGHSGKDGGASMDKSRPPSPVRLPQMKTGTPSPEGAGSG